MSRRAISQGHAEMNQTSTLVVPTSFIKIDFSSPYFKTVRNAFKKLLSPVYGDQTNALQKLKDGKDRSCEIMLNFENPVGILVYKNTLQNEYGLMNALELKTLFLLNPQKNSGKGFGSTLFKRIDRIAREMGSKIVYCTASSKVAESIKCALKNGFEISKILEENEEHTLYLLIKDVQ